jgi:hypothetical protein
MVMYKNKKVALISDRGLPNKTQFFVETPPIIASQIKACLASIKSVRRNLLDTYPGVKFSFAEVDEFGKLIRE